MRRQLLQFLRCPECFSSLDLVVLKERGDRIIDGILPCKCGQQFAIIDEIPRFVYFPEESIFKDYQRRYSTRINLKRYPNHLIEGEIKTKKSFDFEWKVSKKTITQEEIYSNKRRFLQAIGRDEDANLLRGSLFLDAGCGAGRYSVVASSFGAHVIAIDLSTEAVQSTLEISRDLPNIDVVQGSLLSIPFKKNTFDIVFCVGVLHHTPDILNGFMNLTHVLRENGLMILGVYKLYSFSNLYKFLRKITVRLPHGILYALSFLAIPLSYIPGLKYICYPWIDEKDHWRKKVIETFDHYSPYYQGYYSLDEIESWFKRYGPYTNIRFNRNAGTFLANKCRS
jgi:SAM-dependent methyltransferase